MTDQREFDVKVEKAGSKASPPKWERRLYAVADWLDIQLGIRFWVLAGLIVASLVFGTPHVLLQYQCYGYCGPNATEFNCQYLGVRGWQVTDAERGKCPRVRLI